MRLLCSTLLSTIVAISAHVPQAALAYPPPDVTYQGRLTDPTGAPLAGPVNLQLRVYEAPAPVPGELSLYVEDHDGVGLSDGVFSIRLGAGSVVAGSFGPAVFSGMNRFLQVHVNGERLLPRQAFSSVPYALVAASATESRLQVFDGNGERVGLLVHDDSDSGTSVGAFREEIGASIWVSKSTGQLSWVGSLLYVQPGCNGPAYSQSFAAGKLLGALGGTYFAAGTSSGATRDVLSLRDLDVATGSFGPCTAWSVHPSPIASVPVVAVPSVGLTFPLALPHYIGPGASSPTP
jgi:hypothetical protein